LPGAAAIEILVVVGLAACSDDRLPIEPEAPGLAGPQADVTAAGVPNTWETRAPMPTARRGLVAATVNGIVYAIGGQAVSSSAFQTVEAYDPASDSWSVMAHSRRGASPAGRQ